MLVLMSISKKQLYAAAKNAEETIVLKSKEEYERRITELMLPRRFLWFKLERTRAGAELFFRRNMSLNFIGPMFRDRDMAEKLIRLCECSITPDFVLVEECVGSFVEKWLPKK